MKLDRNINGTGRGKYGLINNRKLSQWQGAFQEDRIRAAVKTLEDAGIIEWGLPGTEGEFFVIKLRDTHAESALTGYYTDIKDDEEYRLEVATLADRAGPNSPFCKKPD
jgi:hypothetical protein